MKISNFFGFYNAIAAAPSMSNGNIIISTCDNSTNLLTKSLYVAKFGHCLNLIGWCLLMSFPLWVFLWKRSRFFLLKIGVCSLHWNSCLVEIVKIDASNS